MSTLTKPPLAVARLFGWALFLVRFVVLDTLELLRGHAIHDYASFHAAACAVRAGVSPYRPDELLFGSVSCGMGPVYPYLYPPLLAELLVPATFVDPWTARLSWHALNVVAVIAAVWLLDRWLDDRGAEKSAAFMLVAGSFWPLRESHLMGQVNTIVLLLLCVWWTQRDKRPLAVLALAGAAAIKMSPAILFLVPLIEKKWRELWHGAAAATVMVLVSCALIGKRGFEFLFGVIGGFLPGGHWHSLKLPIDIFGNHSLAAFLIRLAPVNDPQRLPRGRAIIQTLILLAMLGAFLYRVRALAPEARALPLVVLMIVVPTFVWEHHVTFALLAIAMLIAVATTQRWWYVAIGAVAVAMMADRLDYYVLPPFKFSKAFLAIARSPKLPSLMVLFVLGLFATTPQATPGAAPQTSPEPIEPAPPPDPPSSQGAAPAPQSASPGRRRRRR